MIEEDDRSEEEKKQSKIKTFVILLVVISVSLSIIIGGLYAIETGLVDNDKTQYYVDSTPISDVEATENEIIQYEKLSEQTQEEFRDSAAYENRHISETESLEGISYVELDGSYYEVSSEQRETLPSVFITVAMFISAFAFAISVFASLFVWASLQKMLSAPISERTLFILSSIVSVLAGGLTLNGMWNSINPVLRVAETSKEHTVSATNFEQAEKVELMRGAASGSVQEGTDLSAYVGEYVRTNGEVYKVTDITGSILARFIQEPIWSFSSVIMSIIILFGVFILLGILFLPIVREKDENSEDTTESTDE